MADKDEEWIGQIVEGNPLLSDRIETLEAGEPAEEVLLPTPPIEERVARLERIAEYLHDARQEAAALATSVETLAEATKALTDLLIAIEEQQQRIEHLGTRVDDAETKGDEFRDKIVRRAVTTALVLGLFLALLAGGLLAFQRAQEADAEMRCEARNEQADITADTFREVLAVIPEDAPTATAIRDGLERFEKIIVPCEGALA